MMRLKDFYIKLYHNDLEATLDVDSLMKLFDCDFIELQENEMQDYFDSLNNRGIFKIKCHECRSFIKSPKDLVRYFKDNLHKNCFRDFYPNKKQKLNSTERRYFDRIYSLVILGNREILF